MLSRCMFSSAGVSRFGRFANKKTLLRAGAASQSSPLFRDMSTLPNLVAEQLRAKGIKAGEKGGPQIYYQPNVGELYELSVTAQDLDAGKTVVADSGALIAYSGAKTGRTPNEKRIVKEASSEDKVWWGPVNIPLSEKSWDINRNRGVDYMNTRPRIYILDGFAGWDPEHRIRVRVVSTRSYHCLFMRNMLIRPTEEELKLFEEGQPDFTIFNAGEFPCNDLTDGMTSKTSVDVNIGKGEVVILGTQYAGEMKKGVFSIMHYLMPQEGVLSLHSSANQGEAGDATLLFGLSGTGKTTLSADPKRQLIGDDEHCWTERGIFNIEGGCYAKCNNLSSEKEPDIWNAIRFGSVLENVVYDKNRHVDFDDTSLTENTRLSYPIEYMANAKIPCVGNHPKNIIFLTADAFGVLPPVSKLTPEQAMYHFIAGYTAKVAGTEEGVNEPQATFSACFGEAFLMLHPTQYADMLAEKMQNHKADAWLVNTGWTGGQYGTGERMSLKHTRAIIDAIHSGELADADTTTMPVFNLEVPKQCTGVPDKVLMPSKAWGDQDEEFNATVRKLADMFKASFKKYEDRASAAVIAAGPQ
jgi:ATP-dependent phosphoenolpyruvate carboxykinase